MLQNINFLYFMQINLVYKHIFEEKMLKYPILLLFTVLFRFSFSQEISYENKVYKEKIKTVEFYQIDSKFSIPLIDLKNPKSLILSFDDLNENGTDYYYTIIHCNSNWEPSDISSIEYIDGFKENVISEYENSFNTKVPYRHYEILFPDEDIKPLLSGNYLFLVYEGYGREKLVLSQRFFVVDSNVKIEAEIKRSSVVSSIDNSQEITFKIIDNSNFIFNSGDNMNVTIFQNQNQYNYISQIKPDFIKSNVYEYNNARKLRFRGGNEYRFFNVKNTKYVNQRVKSIYHESPYYFFELTDDFKKSNLSYTYQEDINGKFLVTADYVENDETEAEYVYVDLKYKSDFIPEGNIYVYGELSGWETNKTNEMYYNYSDRAYNLRMLLKQGFYNYQFVFVNSKENKQNLMFTEGDFYETENDYYIFVYYKNPSNLYEEIIGYKVLNTMKKI
jgi:hypothetical protein